MRRIDFEARLRAKAWKDEGFQQRLTADPKGTLEAELTEIEEGVELPDDLHVRVVEEAPNEICLVIPQHPKHAVGRELTSEELESVAGGAVSSDSTSPLTMATTSVLDACSVVVCSDPVGIVASAVIGGTTIIVDGG